MSGAVDKKEFTRWLERTEGITPEQIAQVVSDPRYLSLGNIYRALNERGGAQLLQDLAIADAEGKKAQGLDNAHGRASSVTEGHRTLNLSDSSGVIVEDMRRVLASDVSQEWLREAAGQYRWVEKPDAQRLLGIDAKIAHLQCRNTVADLLRPRITREEHGRIAACVETSGTADLEALFALCNERCAASPVPHKDTKDALEMCAAGPDDAEWKLLFLQAFLSHAVVEEPKKG